MSAKLEQLLSAMILICRYSEDHGRAERVLDVALRALVNPVRHPPEPVDRRTDAMGAPLVPPSQPVEWENLRLAVRAVATEVGWPEAARRYGGRPQALKDIVYRNRTPGAGRQARLMRIITSGTRH